MSYFVIAIAISFLWKKNNPERINMHEGTFIILQQQACNCFTLASSRIQLILNGQKRVKQAI